MNRGDLNYWVDLGLFISFSLVGVTGVLKFFLIQRWLEVQLFGSGLRLMSKVHDWSGIVVVMLLLVHLILHWKWIVGMTKRKLGLDKKRNGSD